MRLRPLWECVEPGEAIDYLFGWTDWPPNQTAKPPQRWVVEVDDDGVAWTYCLTE